MIRSLPTRVWQLGLIVGMLGCTGCGVTLAPPGFVHEHRHSVCRGWFDFNSYGRPSFTFERYDHLPPNSARVKLFRWRHGGSVEKVPQIEIVKDSSHVTYGSHDNLSSEPCLEAAVPPAPNNSSEEPMDVNPKSVPPPAPPSETQNQTFPRFIPPQPETDDCIVAIPVPADQLHVVFKNVKVVDVSQEPFFTEDKGPFVPPVPALPE